MHIANKIKYLDIIRYNDWWLYKLPFLLSIAYSTFYVVGSCVEDKWVEVFKMIAYISSAATYVSIINNFTDREIDRRVGKKNLFLELSNSKVKGILFLVVGLQLIVIFSLLNHGQSVYWYFLAILTFSLYSIPPIRLKNNKYFSVLSDACGAHAFASMFIVSYIKSIIDVPVKDTWVLVIFLWSLAYGIRGIFYHQYIDKKNDLEVGIRTFANSASIKTVKLIITLVFSIELVSLIYLLIGINSMLVYASLLIYLLIMTARALLSPSKIIIALSSSGYYQILLAEFYEVFLPLSILLSFKNCDQVWLIVIFQLLLFPTRIITIFREGINYSKKLKRLLFNKIK